ncbi:hypothetical protein NC653_032051 [Populus alba x Populus x berolinensis]|uniref:Uncharacterized protein n=1 Tax=Populus alba x Populus x berolinensis TaxID=444605 RepID=A0AAD6PZB4_9ROSI|nr:hypothetical protein NC653_032051 [Populus alba x Populus x berolinensis]
MLLAFHSCYFKSSPFLYSILIHLSFKFVSTQLLCFPPPFLPRKQFLLCFFFCFCRRCFLLYIGHALFYLFCFLSNILFCFAGSAFYSSLDLRLCKV